MAQFDFLTEYVLELLNQNGLGNLTEDQKNAYIPRLLAQVEERIGLEMLPRLNDAQMEMFASMVENEKTSPEDWKEFWYASIPNFEEELQKVLAGFAGDVERILSA